MDWFPSYPTDYRNDTWHLSLAEHGAYKLLIDYYYQSEMALPNNDNALASIIGVALDDWMQAKENVLPFFQIRENKLFHKKIDEVLESQISKRKDGAARIKKYRKNKVYDVTNEDVTRYTSVSNATRGEERRLEEEKDIDKSISKKSHKKRATRISEYWLPDEKDLDYAIKKGFNNEQIQSASEGFRDHWIAASGKGSTALDWNAKWRTWINNDIKWNGSPETRNGARNLSPHEGLHSAAALAVRLIDGG
jgi:uncharacterized protein YdaU (DUF1376 family)